MTGAGDSVEKEFIYLMSVVNAMLYIYIRICFYNILYMYIGVCVLMSTSYE